jgi:hypothetical protein
VLASDSWLFVEGWKGSVQAVGLQNMLWRLLASRIAITIPEQLPQFDDAICIYRKTVQVNQFNRNRLRNLNWPVLAIQASHQGVNTAQASTDDGGNLQSVICLSISTRVMLLENI